MALPTGGEISFSQITVELGGSSNQELSIKEAADGTLVTLNTNSANIPDASAPHSISEWYGYDHTASGTSLTEFNAGGPFGDEEEACAIQDNGDTFYHDGSSSLPGTNDIVYKVSNGSQTAEEGVYFVNTGLILVLDYYGEVIYLTNCPR